MTQSIHAQDGEAAGGSGFIGDFPADRLAVLVGLFRRDIVGDGLAAGRASPRAMPIA